MTLDRNFIADIRALVINARDNAVRAVDHQRTLLYWQVGERIFNEEQQGMERADYGSYLIRTIANELEPEFGSGFSVRQLELMRQFYRAFPIANALRSQLGWTHYRSLIRIDNQDKRDFYMAEAVKNNWTTRQLDRQINSGLWERLLTSGDAERVLAVARNEKGVSRASDIIKDPMYLEFLGLRQDAAFYERDLEQAIITHLHDFLLELGNGFAFVARQKRIHLDGDDFFIDLVFYNRLLQCFVLIEIKTDKLTHQDIGQLQMYVNYYDRCEKQPFENPTLGILLCADKNNAVVRMTLPEDNSSIVASRYKLYLPSEKQLVNEIRKEMDRQENLPSSDSIPKP